MFDEVPNTPLQSSKRPKAAFTLIAAYSKYLELIAFGLLWGIFCHLNNEKLFKISVASYTISYFLPVP